MTVPQEPFGRFFPPGTVVTAREVPSAGTWVRTGRHPGQVFHVTRVLPDHIEVYGGDRHPEGNHQFRAFPLDEPLKPAKEPTHYKDWASVRPGRGL